MAFPITVNGTTWDSSDFAASKYAANLGKFIYDLVWDRANKLTGFATDAQSFSAGSKTFTVGTGKGFAPGMTVVISAPSTAPANFAGGIMSGRVSGYAAGVLSVEVDKYYNIAGTNSLWEISINAAGRDKNTSDSPTTTDDIKKCLMTHAPQVVTEVLEDFCGALDTPFNGSNQRSSWNRNFDIQTVGGATVTGNGNVSESICDPNHPGIAVVTMNNVNSVALFQVAGSPYGNCVINGALNYVGSGRPSSQCFQVCFKLKDSMFNGSTDSIQLIAGLAYGSEIGSISAGLNIRPILQLDGAGGGTTISNMGFVIRSGVGDMSPAQAATTLNSLKATDMGLDLSAPAISTVLPKDRWLTLRIIRLGTDLVRVHLLDNDSLLDNATREIFKAEWDLSGYSGLYSGQSGFIPFIGFKKLHGNHSMKVLIDYLHFIAEANRY